MQSLVATRFKVRVGVQFLGAFFRLAVPQRAVEHSSGHPKYAPEPVALLSPLKRQNEIFWQLNLPGTFVPS